MVAICLSLVFFWLVAGPLATYLCAPIFFVGCVLSYFLGDVSFNALPLHLNYEVCEPGNLNQDHTHLQHVLADLRRFLRVLRLHNSELVLCERR